MPVLTEDDWSDSDEDVGTGLGTDVLLGVPDGCVETGADIKDAAISRIGGLPAFLPSPEPPFATCQCRACSNPMELLLQVWCPFEDSPMDRALYVWGCARSACQRHAGSIRAWRGLRYNAAYATKLKEKKKKTQNNGQQKAVTSSPPNPTTLANPFSMKTTVKPVAFGLGDQIFGNSAADIPDQREQDHDDHSDAESDDSEDSLVTAMASTSVADSFWTVAPSYPAIYLSTQFEYIPQPFKTKVPTNARMEDPVEMDGKAGKDATTWTLEAYGNSLEIDNVFDSFTKRVAFTGEQCLRYELGGIPLPFASDKVFELLFPTPTQAPLPVTKGDFKVVRPVKRSYNTASIPPCPWCKSSRVFECQLMPNLINVLRDSVDDKDLDVRRLTDEQRIKAVQSNEPGSRGMEWGTCMVFSCGNDCCLDDGGQDDKQCWREEYVLVQWDE